MIDTGFAELNKQQEYLILLDAYRTEDSVAREGNPEFDGWLPRINSVDGIATELLSRVHGKLISLGYLKFQLGNRLEGMRYQLSRDARRALSDQPFAEVAEDGDDESSDD